MATQTAIHLAIVAAVVASGGEEATTPWSLDAFPDTLRNGGFFCRPLTGGVSPVDGARAPVDSMTYEVLVPWRLTGVPSTAARACMEAAAVIRDALTGGVLADGRPYVDEISYEYSDDGHRMLARLRVVVMATFSI